MCSLSASRILHLTCYFVKTLTFIVLFRKSDLNLSVNAKRNKTKRQSFTFRGIGFFFSHKISSAAVFIL